MQTIQGESEQKLMDLMWVTRVTPSFFELSVHLLNKALPS